MSEARDRIAARVLRRVPAGVSELLAGELRELGIDVEREHPAGVAFRGAADATAIAPACFRAPRAACW